MCKLLRGAGVVYNGISGAIIKLSQGAFDRRGEIIRSTPEGQPPNSEYEADPLFEHLTAGGFVIEDGFDELAFIEEQYQRERQRSQFMLTILPTFGCNLGCDYCFVGKKSGKMSRERQAQVIDFVAAQGWLGPETLFFPYLARISPYHRCLRFSRNGDLFGG